MPTIFFDSDDVSFHWHNEAVVIVWLNQIARSEKIKIISLSYVFCSDHKLLEINKKYLNHDYFTDVITFDLSESDDIEGEIYISTDRISEHAVEYSVSFEEELCRVIAHGLLHLMGYDDKTEEQQQEMRSKEFMCLSLLQEVPRGTLLV
ncbi:MAG: rRNA maturation RNase YbeY [Cytophagales bacterium]|nr:rRNA maturation RNase YbeY [Cytophagales bacterium]